MRTPKLTFFLVTWKETHNWGMIFLAEQQQNCCSFWLKAKKSHKISFRKYWRIKSKMIWWSLPNTNISIYLVNNNLFACICQQWCQSILCQYGCDDWYRCHWRCSAPLKWFIFFLRRLFEVSPDNLTEWAVKISPSYENQGDEIYYD